MYTVGECPRLERGSFLMNVRRISVPFATCCQKLRQVVLDASCPPVSSVPGCCGTSMVLKGKCWKQMENIASLWAEVEPGEPGAAQAASPARRSATAGPQ